MASGLKNWPKWILVPIPHNLIFSDFKQCVLNVLSYLDRPREEHISIDVTLEQQRFIAKILVKSNLRNIN